VQTAPLLAESQPDSQTRKKRAFASASDDFKAPLPLAELANAMRGGRSFDPFSPPDAAAAPVATSTTAMYSNVGDDNYAGVLDFKPLVPDLQPIFFAAPDAVAAAVAAPVYSASVVDEPSDPVMSARSAQVFTLHISGPHIDKVTVFTENEAGVKSSEGVLVESSTAQPGRGDDGECIVLQVRLRFKAQRLQVRRAVFECLIKTHASDANTVLLEARSAPFIVCSHITSQRPLAVKRLEATRARISVGVLNERIVELYAECNFTRQLVARDMTFLRETAIQTAGVDANATDAVLFDSKPFWIWLRKALKLLQALRPYWESGAIAGFVGRNEAVELLADQPDGTCVVRFSSSVPKAFAVTCNIGGAISNKMIDKTAAGDWKLFTSSLRSFSGNLSAVVDIFGRAVPFGVAFPPISDGEAPPTPKQEDGGGYDETRSVNELVNDLRKATLN
jgi:hypothetical protein